MNYGGKPKKNTNCKKKSEKYEKVKACCVCVCGKEGHLAKNYRYRKDRDDGKLNKNVNITIGDGDEAGGSRYGNFQVIFSVLQSRVHGAHNKRLTGHGTTSASTSPKRGSLPRFYDSPP